MRNIILVSMACELLLLAGAILAGAPVLTLVRAAARRGANAVILCSLALATWVAAGLAINGIVDRLPNSGQFAMWPVRIGDVDLNLAIFVPMILISLAIVYLLAISLIAAGRGRALRDCVRIAARLNAR